MLHAEKWSSTAGAVLVGVVDTDPDRRLAAAERFGVPACADFRELLEEVDAVSIAVPAVAHYETARECLLRGVNVLVEKPIAIDLAEADHLIELARSRNLQFQVGHLERFNLVLNAIRQWVPEPRLVQVRRQVPWTGRALDVDVVLDLMIHDIDWVSGMVDAPVVHVKAEGGSVRSGALDVVNARLYFRNGCIADLAASRVAAQPERTVRVVGDEARLELDLLSGEFTVRHNRGLRLDDVEKHQYPRGDLLRLEIELFIDSLLDRRPPLVDGETARRALDVALKVSQVASTGESWIAQQSG